MTTCTPYKAEVQEQGNVVTMPDPETERYVLPLADIYESDNALFAVIDLPGVGQDGIEVKLADGVLTVVGRPVREIHGRLRHSEFYPYPFRRQFELGEGIDSERIEATLKNGVLTLKLPKAETHKPRTIAVNAG